MKISIAFRYWNVIYERKLTFALKKLISLQILNSNRKIFHFLRRLLNRELYYKTFIHATNLCRIKSLFTFAEFCIFFFLPYVQGHLGYTTHTGDFLLTTSYVVLHSSQNSFVYFGFNLKIQNSVLLSNITWIRDSEAEEREENRRGNREYSNSMNFITINIWTGELDENFWIAMRKTILIRENWNIFKWAIPTIDFIFCISKKTFYEPIIC